MRPTLRETRQHEQRELVASDSGRGAVGKVAVVGAKERANNRVTAKVVESKSTDKPTLQGFVVKHTAPGAPVYSDEASACEGLPMPHDAVKYSVKEFVRGRVHTNGTESFWSMLKRGYIGVYHKMSPKHLSSYVTEFEDQHNDRERDTIKQMGHLVEGMGGKRLAYETRTASNGLPSGARGS